MIAADLAFERARMADWGLARYTGRVALVTGGASGIGRATAVRLLAEGARVRVVDSALFPDDLRAAGIDVVRCDVRDEGAVEDAVAQLIDSEGKLDLIVNAAGIAAAGTTVKTSLSEWDRVHAVNLTGTFMRTRAALKVMKPGASVVNVASDAGLVGQRGQAAYVSSKGAVVQFTKAAALDAAPQGIRVNCVCPCFVETPMVSDWLARQPRPEAARRAAVQTQPIGRMGQAHEIAAAIAWLGSHEASFVTGHALQVDGGTTAE